MDREEIIKHLTETPLRTIMERADEVRQKVCGHGVIVRAIIDFSNNCIRNCLYCGLRANNERITRYRMKPEEILIAARSIYDAGIRTIILQSGDDYAFSRNDICGIITALKTAFPDTALTLSIGERPQDDYTAFKDAGADRYLLKHETANEKLYTTYHPDMSLKKRLKILELLRNIGYQVGVGCIIGLPGQSVDDLADDIEFMQRFQPDMAGIGPFIPQEETPLCHAKRGSVETTLRMVALTRIVCPKTHIPATTALANIDDGQGQIDALKGGANVIMPDFTPPDFGKHYRIYAKKTRVTLEYACRTIALAGRIPVFERGDSLQPALPE